MGSVKTEVDGIVFASKKEADRYRLLKMCLAQKQIRNLKLQPKFPMVLNGKKICTYIADFQYEVGTELVIEDIKSEWTAKLPVFRLKHKMFEAFYPHLRLTLVQ